MFLNKMWGPEDFDKEKIGKIICWVSIIIFGFIGIIQLFPSILWGIIILGISIPTYFLIKKRNEE